MIHWYKVLQYLFVSVAVGLSFVQAQFYDTRCICICPNPSALSGQKISRGDVKQYGPVGNVTRSECDCENFVLPKVIDEVRGKEHEFCLRCRCTFETRNTSIIMYVVIFLICVITSLVLYMIFLLCLEPFLKTRVKGNYQEQSDEEVIGDMIIDETSGTSQPIRVRGNVLNRVGHQQDKWKRKVQEQRRYIYDRHTMLN